MTFKKILLSRRRIDPWILAAGMVCVALYLPPAVAIAGLFGILGLYVVLSKRRRFIQHLRGPIPWILAYIGWALLLMAWRNELFTLHNNRQLGFLGLLLGLSFVGPGLCLVRQPLRWLVLGARVGTVAAFLAPLLFEFVLHRGPARWDGGGNAAIVAIIVLLAAVAAIIPVEKPWRYLPNGPIYLLLAAVPIFLSETRAVLLIIPLILGLEFGICSLRWRPRWRNRAYVSSAAAISLLLLAPPIQNVIAERFMTVYEYYVEGEQSHDMASGDIRLALWETSITVISQHPFIGVGLKDTFTELEKVAGPNLPYVEGGKHVHNFILQELLANGPAGLFLLFSIFASLALTIWREANSNELKRASFYYFGSIAVFGLLHDPFYHELCMSATMLFLGVLLAQFSRWRRLTPAAQKVV